jgi:ribonuclease VapC
VSDKLDEFLSEFAIEVVPLEKSHVDAAFEGFRRFGKGVHPARLNFGDCFSYGLAKTLNEPLLFKGNDFSQTDVAGAA